jgi:hypothetical protein
MTIDRHGQLKRRNTSLGLIHQPRLDINSIGLGEKPACLKSTMAQLMANADRRQNVPPFSTDRSTDWN